MEGESGNKGFVVSTWFDDSASEKNIEIFNKETWKISCFIVNGMSPGELKKKLDRTIEALRKRNKKAHEDVLS